ncbi:MAG: hypothetical protein JSV56_12070 [Methanomassiliicoccales archaeon]|nr:MAG: hypothetical protein JSV56_12070 [Methanomassiliicoccales archaeon]
MPKGNFFKITSGWLVLLMVFIIFIQLNTENSSADPFLYRHHVIMIQGNDPDTAEIEPGNEMLAIERFFLLVPWNESFVDLPVPLAMKIGSQDIDHVGYSDMFGYVPGQYSLYMNPGDSPYKEFRNMEDMTCCIAHSFVWGFPKGADRNQSQDIHLDTGSAFKENMDDSRSIDVWNFSEDTMKLKMGEYSGEYISTATKMGAHIPKVEIDWNISMHKENVTFLISNNNGTNWLDMTSHKGEEVNFSVQGNELIWKINMTQNITLNNTPVLTDLWINVTYTPMYSDIILQLDYVLERKSDKFEFTMDLYKDYDDGVVPHILIYTDKDHIVESEDIPLTLYGSQSEYPGKDVYIFMAGSFSPEAAITVQKVEEESQISWLLIFPLILIIIFVGAFLMGRARKREMTKSAEGQTATADNGDMEELARKKEGLLTALKELDSDFEEGNLDEDIYNELRSTYKKKAAEVMSQMDALTAAAVPSAKEPEEPEISDERKTLLSKKKKILKSIKKLDSDYKDGILDEDVYKELRQSYKEKAVEVMKELEGN